MSDSDQLTHADGGYRPHSPWSFAGPHLVLVAPLPTVVAAFSRMRPE